MIAKLIDALRAFFTVERDTIDGEEIPNVFPL